MFVCLFESLIWKIKTIYIFSTVRENWIRAKYVTKSFVKLFNKPRVKLTVLSDAVAKTGRANSKLEIISDDEETSGSDESIVSTETPTDLLHLASAYASLELMMYALVLDADRNSIIDRMDFYSNVDADVSVEEVPTNTAKYGFTPLIKAVHSGSIQAVELLLLNGAKLTICDFNGRSPLHHATILKDLRLVFLLIFLVKFLAI